MLYRLIIGLLAGQASGLMFAPMVSTPGLRTAVSPVMQYGGHEFSQRLLAGKAGAVLPALVARVRAVRAERGGGGGGGSSSAAAPPP